MLNAIQNAFIEALKAAREKGYPGTIEPYTGQLLRLTEYIHAVPAVLVHLAGGQFDRWDGAGATHAARHTVDILTLDVNPSGMEGQSADTHRLMEWVLDNLPGKVLKDGSLNLAYAGPVKYEIMITDKAGDALVQVGRVSFDATIYGRK
ncbi:MAG TPA: hypothetical protein ENJ15_04450 [Caldithrix abyssi]|uniref:Uncharacterized protein n=1 Tax=Caldithrix abyssi TaxID=187145 RepID=A0A7V5RPY6_CALAY|nr:hypothetical protein [Caldithrix abyssi]